MNKISPSIVMVEDISSSLSRATFSEADLEKAAQLILKMEGTITPIILQKNGIDSYTVIDGDFEYYAALKAEEIDPMKGETINAYVIKSKKDLPFYKKQIEVFRKKSIVDPSPEKPTEETVKQEEKPVISTLNQTVDFQPIMNAMSILNDLVTGIINQQKVLQEAIAKITIKNPESTLKAEFLKELNNLSDAQLENKLKQAKANKRVIKNILLERKKKLFESLEELIKCVDGLAEKTLIKILDNWS